MSTRLARNALILMLCAGSSCVQVPAVDEAVYALPNGAAEPSAATEASTPIACAGSIPILYGDDFSFSARLYSGALELCYREWTRGADGDLRIEEIAYSCPTAVPVQSVAGRQTSEVFVLGQDGSIEQWALEIPNGSRFVTIKDNDPRHVRPIPELETGIRGGTSVSMADRPKGLDQHRRRILAPSNAVKYTSLMVDPEGRYLLLQTPSPYAVHQLDLTPNAVPRCIADTTRHPELAQASGGYLAHHSTLGRVFVMTYGGLSQSKVILIDADNDAEFEASLHLSAEQWLAQGFEGPVWVAPSFYDIGSE